MKELKIIRKAWFWLLLMAALVWAAVLQRPDEKLHLIFCNVGQGDAILISYQDQQVLVDGGPDDQVLDCLSRHLPYFDRQIEMVVVTHPEADHLTGLVSVIERYNVKQFLINSIAKDSAVFRHFREAVINEGVPVYSPKSGDQLKIGSVNLTVLWPKEKFGDNRIWFSDSSLAGITQSDILGESVFTGEVNDTSIVLKLSFGDFDVLLPGDISTEVEGDLTVSDVEILKVAHHGSKYSTGEQFLENFNPELAIISVGQNSFGHPTTQVLQELEKDNVKLLRTDKDGEVEIVSDGEIWGVKR